jgi:uncharacterized membrane protein
MTDVVPVAESDHRHNRAGDHPAVHTPIHPRWTHAPVGGVLFVVVFDVLSAVAGSSRPWARELYRSGTFVLSAMLALIAVAVASGFADRARLTAAHARVRARVNLHAAVMTAMAAASAGNLALRRLAYADGRHTPAAVLTVSVVALVAAVVGGDLGGRLTYRAGVGVRPQESSKGSAADDPH